MPVWADVPSATQVTWLSAAQTGEATCLAFHLTDKHFVCVVMSCVACTVTSENVFRFLLSLQLSGGLFLGLLALTPCLFPPSNVPQSNTVPHLPCRPEPGAKRAVKNGYPPLATVVALSLVTGLTTTLGTVAAEEKIIDALTYLISERIEQASGSL